MQDNQPSCPYDDTDADERYLAGTLSPTDADAFERHYFECDRCWASVQRGSEIKAALADTPVVSIDLAREPRPAPGRRSTTRWASPLAAAAVLLLGFGLWRYRTSAELAGVPGQPVDTTQIMRGTAKNIAVSSHLNGSTLIAAWTSAPSASSYRVRLLAADGVLLFERETSDTSLVLPNDSAGIKRSTGYWEIQALNELRSVIAASPLTPATSSGDHR